MIKKNLKIFAISALIMISLLFGAGCTLITTTTATPPPAASATSTQESTAAPSIAQTQTQANPVVQISGPAEPLPDIADVVAKVKPSVVAINTEIAVYDFFNQQSTEQGAGSGWIISPDGYIITNNHVVADANSISVTLNDGRTFSVNPKTVVTDPVSDLAVLKINATGLPAAQVGDSSKMMVDDWVVAIGNSLGEGIRATEGIISLKNATVPVDNNQTLYGLIETDAAINEGNSGGPLVNMAGQVIGITSAKLAAVGVEGTGFAISTATAIPVIQQLMSQGHAIHPWLGVSLYDLDPVVVQDYGLAVSKGALLVDVARGSPAALAGLQVKDIIVSFGGKTINTADDLTQAIHQAQVGQKVDIVYYRGNIKKVTTATLTERPGN